MKILTSAQAFGYGPSSKLVTIARLLKSLYANSVSIDFIGNDISLEYVSRNSENFDEIIKWEGAYPKPDDYSFVLGIMDPHIILWAFIHERKSLNVDSL